MWSTAAASGEATRTTASDVLRERRLTVATAKLLLRRTAASKRAAETSLDNEGVEGGGAADEARKGESFNVVKEAYGHADAQTLEDAQSFLHPTQL